MDCKTAQRLMELCRSAHDDWAAPELTGAAAHLEECPDCLGQFRTRQAFDARVVAAMSAVPIPENLHDRILHRLDRVPIVRWRRCVVAWGLAAAAVLVLAVSFAKWPKPPREPVVAASNAKALGESAVAAVDENLLKSLVEVPADLTDPIALRDWSVARLKRLRLKPTHPLRWLTTGLHAIAETTVANQRVAVFQYDYLDGRCSADVIALPHAEFDMSALDLSRWPIYQTRNMVVIAWTEGDTTYVAVLKNWPQQDLKRVLSPTGNLT